MTEILSLEDSLVTGFEVNSFDRNCMVQFWSLICSGSLNCVIIISGSVKLDFSDNSSSSLKLSGANRWLNSKWWFTIQPPDTAASLRRFC